MQGGEEYIPCRAELASPTSEWDMCWRVCRLKGLGSDLTIHCNYNGGVGQSLLSVAQTYVPDIPAAALLRLEVANLTEEMEQKIVILYSYLY